MDAKDLNLKVKEDNVKFISFQFTDVTGAVKSVDAPLLESALEDEMGSMVLQKLRIGRKCVFGNRPEHICYLAMVIP